MRLSGTGHYKGSQIVSSLIYFICGSPDSVCFHGCQGYGSLIRIWSGETLVLLLPEPCLSLSVPALPATPLLICLAFLSLSSLYGHPLDARAIWYQTMCCLPFIFVGLLYAAFLEPASEAICNVDWHSWSCQRLASVFPSPTKRYTPTCRMQSNLALRFIIL